MWFVGDNRYWATPRWLDYQFLCGGLRKVVSPAETRQQMGASCYCSTSALWVRAQNTFSGKFQALIHRRHFLLSASFHVFSMNKILPGTWVVGPPGSNISQMDFFKMTQNSWHFPFSPECWVAHKWNFIRNCLQFIEKGSQSTDTYCPPYKREE